MLNPRQVQTVRATVDQSATALWDPNPAPISFNFFLVSFQRSRNRSNATTRRSFKNWWGGRTFLTPVSNRCSLQLAEGRPMCWRGCPLMIIQNTYPVCTHTRRWEVTADGKYPPCEAPVSLHQAVRKQKGPGYCLRQVDKSKKFSSNLGLFILWSFLKQSYLQEQMYVNAGVCKWTYEKALFHVTSPDVCYTLRSTHRWK